MGNISSGKGQVAFPLVVWCRLLRNKYNLPFYWACSDCSHSIHELQAIKLEKSLASTSAVRVTHMRRIGYWPTLSNQFDEQYFHEKLGKWHQTYYTASLRIQDSSRRTPSIDMGSLHAQQFSRIMYEASTIYATCIREH